MDTFFSKIYNFFLNTTGRSLNAMMNILNFTLVTAGGLKKTSRNGWNSLRE